MRNCSPACWLRWGIGAAVVLAVSLAAAAGWRGWNLAQASRAPAEGVAPRIEPDYSGITIPPNLCPLNFKIAETGAWFYAEAGGKAGTPVKVLSHGPGIVFPERAWRELLTANKGGELRFEIGRKRADGSWQRFAALTNQVATEAIDSHLMYRKLHPVHNTWNQMGIYQRDLASFRETPILENKTFGHDCCHCHATANNDPNRLSLDIRSSKFGNSWINISNGIAHKTGGTMGFAARHPQGHLIACSFSQPRLLLSGSRSEMREIVDMDDQLGYLVEGGAQVKRIPGVPLDRLATFPTWSPDGRYLYFCGATNIWKIPGKTRNQNYNEIKFELMRIPCDPQQERWGEAEMIVPAAETGKSAVQPRISPDGRWLTFLLCDYGCWPVYHSESDLYAIDLDAAKQTGKFAWHRLEINSSDCESWHAWSSNSRWVVIKSKRGTPLLGRPYFSHVDENGHFSKPFPLPQRDPTFYESCLLTFTLPEFLTGPVAVNAAQLAHTIKSAGEHALVMPPREIGGTSPEYTNQTATLDDGAGSQQ